MAAMNTVFFDAKVSDDERRGALYNGQLFAYGATPGSQALIDHAQGLIEESFGDLDPPTAQDHMDVEAYAALLSDLKPKFIHHPRSKECIQLFLTDLGCDLDDIYFDVPRMRTATAHEYLTSGIAYAFHPHRDTWYSAPQAQINWWLPIYEVEPDNILAFHPRYWTDPIPNSSNEYNYYEWNATSRKDASKMVKSDTRKQPKPLEEVELDPQIRVLTPVGGPVLFSGAQLHSSVPNTTEKTRFSIDFRTVSLSDLHEGRGAPNIDSACTGTTLRDFLRASDFEHLPEDVVQRYDDETQARGELVYQPDA
jgi:hypothetical protein